MTIVCLGWGSLVWDPRDLPVRGEWHHDGPALPLEFARESGNGRITLVVVDQGQPVLILWAELDVPDIESAVKEIFHRELGSLEAAFGAFRTYQRSVSRIEALTDLYFGDLSQFDGFSNEERATGTRIESELRSPGDIRV